MQYMGGKTRQARFIADLILQHGVGCHTYLEPFVGGASVLALVGRSFKRVVASDVHPDLILMWDALMSGWVPPRHVSEEEYEVLRTAEPSALRGFVGFGCSFGGRWFEGYARSHDEKHTNDFCRAAISSIRRKIRGFGNATFTCCDYRIYNPSDGTVVYGDPPYRETKRYSGVNHFDHDEFWMVMRRWSDNGAVVLVSEYTAPVGVECISQRRALRHLRLIDNSQSSVEKVFKLGESAVIGGLFDLEVETWA